MQERLNAWMTELIAERLKPLVEIDSAQDIAGLARGIAFRLKENFGVLRRESVDARRSARSISRLGRSCASTASASAPSTSISRPC